MTKEEYEEKYGENGAVKVEMEMYYPTISDLIPYFEEINSLRKNAGDEPSTLEKYIEMVLELGCIHTMKRNAELYAGSAKAYYSKHSMNK